MFTVLMVLGALGLLIMSLTQSERMTEAAGRNERDNVFATAAAEAALLVARQDILTSTRGEKMQCLGLAAFPEGCGSTGDEKGLCGPSADGKPGWLSTDLTDPNNPQTQPVDNAKYQLFSQTAQGLAPAHLPRYIIELAEQSPNELTTSGDNASTNEPLTLRITAVGFGPGGAERGQHAVAVLQTLYEGPNRGFTSCMNTLGRH